MGSLGSLNVDLSAEIAQFIAAMDKAAYLTEQAQKKIQRSISESDARMKSFVIGTIAGFASLATIDHFAGLVKGSIDASAALDDMAERTGNTVEQLSGLAQVAKVGGHDISVMEQAMTKLAKGMIAADEETKGAGGALKFLNITAKDANGNLKGTGDLMLEIATGLDKYADGTGKAAIAQALFGKSGAANLPFLKDLAEQGEIVTKVTAEQAAEAERYQKTLGKLAVAKEDLVRVISVSVLPVMQAVANVMLANKTATDGTLESTKKLAADGSITIFAEKAAYGAAFVIDAFRSVSTVVMATGIALGAQLAVVDTYLSGVADMASKAKSFDIFGAAEAGEKARDRIGDIRKQAIEDIRQLYLGQKSVRFELEAQFETYKKIAAASAGAGAGSAKPALNFALPDAAAIKAAKTEAEHLQTLLDKIFNKEAGVDAGFTKDLKFLEDQLEKGNIPSVEEYRRAVETLILQQPFYTKARDAAIKVDIEASELMIKLRDQFKGAVEDTKKQVEAMEFELSTMQLTNTEREISIRLREMELKGVVKGSAAYEEYAERIRAAVESKEGLKSQIDLFKSIESVAHQTWQSITQGGKGAAERIRDSFKNGLFELLYQMTLKPFYINVVASLTGNSTGGAVANALGGSNAIGTVGNLLGLGSSITSLGGLASGAAGAVGLGGLGNFIGGLTGAIAGPALPGSALAAGASVNGALAAIGPVGWIALAATAAYALFSQKRGGDKQGGSFSGSYDASGNLVTGTNASLFGLKPGEGTGNAAVQSIAEATSRSYYELLKRLGGSASGVAFRLAYDEDPLGTAQNRVTSGADVNGLSVYSVKDREFGRGKELIGPELQLEASRIRLAALQNSSLSAVLLKTLKSVNAATATQEQIDAVIKSALALKGFFDTLTNNPVEDAAKQFADSQATMAAAVRKNRDSLAALIDQFDGTTAAAESLAGATSQYYLAQVNLLAQFEEITRSVNEMFGQTFRQIELAGLDKQAQYDFYQKEADAFLEQLLGSSDVNEIQRLAEKINADINAAFGLLDADQQKLQSGDFLDRGREAQRLINEQIRAVQQEVSARTQADMDKVRELLTAAADKQQAAADTFSGAVDNFAGSISGGIDIRVTNSYSGSESGT